MHFAPPPAAGSLRSTTSYLYNVGNDDLVDSISDPLGRISVFTYDAGGRLSQLTEPDPDGAGTGLSAWTNYVRDGLGSIVKTSDRLNQSQTVTSRDAWFRTLSATDPGGALTSFEYDVFGNSTKVTDPLNNVTSYAYNKLNQLVTETQVGSGNRNFMYDAVGNMRYKANRNGQTTQWDYDQRDRVTSETFAGGNIAYTYDSADRITSVTDNSPNAPDFTFTYDSRNQLANELQSHPLMNRNVVFNRSYDVVGNQTLLSANIGGALNGAITGGIWDFRNTYAYDDMNRLTSVVQAGVSGGNTLAKKQANFSYDAASQLTDIRRYSYVSNLASLEVHSRLGYDLAGHLTSVTHGKTEIPTGQTWAGTSSTPVSTGYMLAAYFLTFDADNRVTSFSSWRDAFKTTYSYDAKDQLTAAFSSQIAGLSLPFPLPANETYNLDANGNRRTLGGVSQSAAGTHNRLQTDGTFNYIYDNEGNTTKRTRIVGGQVTEYTWDHRNRLTRVIDRVSATGAKTQQVEYIYDAFDQLTGKRVATQFNPDGITVANWSRYEVFAWADGQEVFRFVDSDGQGAAQPARITDRYLYGAAVDQLLADEQYSIGFGPAVNATSPGTLEGSTLWALTDHLGSVRDLVDNNGVIREHNVYDSFGKLVREVDYNSTGQIIASNNAAAVDTVFGYTGRMIDQHTGLQYNRARWYDSNTGRWLSQDPIGFEAGDANLYRYVGNHPTYATDPSGLQEPIPEPSKVDPTPRPKPVTGWKNPGYPKSSVDSEGPNWVKFKRSLSVSRYKASGFSPANAQTAFERGCFGLTSFRLGRGGSMVTAGDGVGAFQSLDDAWNYLLKLRSQGVDSRILVYSSAYPFTFPAGHDPSMPFRNEDGSLYQSDKGTTMAKYDFAVLHFDDKQKEFCYESQWNGWSDPKDGQNWFAAYPLGGLAHDIFLVVEISPKQATEAQGLPKLPPGLPPIKK